MHSRLRELAFGGAAAACATALAMAPGAAHADIENVALCHGTMAVSLHNGSYEADSNVFACTGLIGSQPISGNGSIQMWGNYTAQSTTHGCQVTFTNSVFYAQMRLALSFFDEGDLTAEGGQTMTGGASMNVTGSGDADYDPFLEVGTASFRPASTDCATLSEGTMTELLTLTDGGDGNPAVDQAIARHLNAQYADPTPSGSARTRTRSGHGHKRHGGHGQAG
jgi:hypothetical protein